jgi:hypothetical protein
MIVGRLLTSQGEQSSPDHGRPPHDSWPPQLAELMGLLGSSTRPPFDRGYV